MAKLIITAGADAGKEHRLSDTQVIGRLPSNPIAINDEGSSRQNTRIYRSGLKFAVIDLNSKNGTYVNGEKVDRAEIRDGDEIRIGSTAFRFVSEQGDDGPSVGAANRDARAASAVTGNPDDVIQYGREGATGPRGVSDRAIRVSKVSSGGTLRFMRTEISQHSALFRTLLLLGALLLMAGVTTLVYKFAAG